MTDIADKEVIDVPDMDVEAFNEFAVEQGWSDGFPLFVPTEAKVGFACIAIATEDEMPMRGGPDGPQN